MGWAQWCVHLAKEQRRRIDDDVAGMQRLLGRLDELGVWKILGKSSFADLCVSELALSASAVSAIRAAKKGDTLAQALARDETVTKTRPGRGRPGKDEEKSGYAPLSSFSSVSAIRLVRRLKRDAPGIAQALANGEYRSARAAAIAAGIVKVQPPLDRVLAMLKKLTPDELETVALAIRNQQHPWAP